ncbi:MAG: M56 family metallopeptidase, partial [Planctomycetota bacterium]
MSLPGSDLLGAVWAQLWQVTALIVIVGVLTHWGCRRRPHLAHGLWMLVLIKCLTPPLWSSPIGVFSWVQTGVAGPPGPASDGALDDRVGLDGLAVPRPVDVGSVSSSAVHAPAEVAVESPGPSRRPAYEPSGSSISGGAILAGLWLSGAVALGVVALLRRLRCRRLLKGTLVATPREVESLGRNLARRLRLRRKVRLLVTSGPVGPATFGVLRPVIVLPEKLLRQSNPGQIEPILAHELVHVRRGDALVGCIQLAAQLAWWFHPLVWWANRRACREAERCCDEEVVAWLECRPTTYVRCLLDVLASERGLEPVSVFPGVHGAESTFTRLEDLMKRTGRFHRRTPAWCWIVLLAAAAVVLPGGAVVLGENAAPPAGTEPAKPQKEAAPAAAAAPQTDASSDEKKPGSGNFLVVPITSNLQRAAGPEYAEAKVFVLINGMALFNEDNTVLNLAAFDDRGLKEAMQGYLRAGVRGTAIFRVCSGPLLPSPEHVQWGASGVFHIFLKNRAGGWFRDFEVEIVHHHHWKYANDWQSLVADLAKPPSEEAIQAESGVGDDQVKVYPVRTPLSRYLYGHDFDCVIHIIPPIHEAGAGILLTMQRSLAQLKLKKKDWVLFLWHGRGGRAAEVNQLREEYFGKHVY